MYVHIHTYDTYIRMVTTGANNVHTYDTYIRILTTVYVAYDD